MKEMWVYIITNRSKTLYIGVTNDLERRMYEHREKIIPGFTSRYNIDRLVYYETCSDPLDAIRREKQLKSWSRSKKIELIEKDNPAWHNFAVEWME